MSLYPPTQWMFLNCTPFFLFFFCSYYAFDLLVFSCPLFVCEGKRRFHTCDPRPWEDTLASRLISLMFAVTIPCEGLITYNVPLVWECDHSVVCLKKKNLMDGCLLCGLLGSPSESVKCYHLYNILYYPPESLGVSLGPLYRANSSGST